MTAHLRLVAPNETSITACSETISVLRQRLKEAEEGDLDGVAMVCVYRGLRQSAYLTGSTKRIPTFTLGAIGRLWSRLERMIE